MPVSLLKDLVFLVLPSLLNVANNILVLSLYSRSLSASDFNFLEIINVAIAFFIIIGTLEIGQAIAREVPTLTYQESLRIFYNGLSVLMFLGLPLLIGLYLSKSIILEFLSIQSHYEKYIHWLIVLCFANAVFKLFQLFLLFQLNRKLTAIINLSCVSIMISLNFYYYFGNNLSVYSFCFTYFCGYAGATLIICMLELKRVLSIKQLQNTLSLDTKLIRRLLQFSIPLVLSSVTILVFQYFDRLILTTQFSAEEMAGYIITNRISGIYNYAFLAFGILFTPKIYRHHADSNFERNYSIVFIVTMALVIATLILTAIFSELIFKNITKVEYLVYAKDLGILCWATCSTHLVKLFPGMEIERKTNQIFLVNLFAAIIAVFSCYVLSLYLGYTGVVLSKYISSTVLLLAYALISRKYLGWPKGITVSMLVFFSLSFYLLSST